MWIWTSSVLLATLLVSGLSLPHPDDDAYEIPDVGDGGRAQYYVLHRDGTYKYGFDTGDGAYESAMSKMVGLQTGSFGYRTPEGDHIHLEYEAGENGFVARGDHLPVPSANLAHAMAAVVRRTEKFVDPLANSGGDASYNFQFDSDVHSRSESSDSDGTVTGSYSYTDENGVLRTFSYRAGKGIGFEITGDGLTIPTAQAASSATGFRSGSATSYSSGSGGATRSSSSSSFGSSLSNGAASSGAAQRTGSSTFTSGARRTFGDANIRSSSSDDGSYSFSYDNSDHSRSEAGANGRVTGDFSFVAADDGQRRKLQYEAGSDTGFIVQADHLPVGPAVPGAEDGQPSGAFARYQDKNFVDPLANTASDSSYQFGFDSDTYSRSETSDKDGNVVGTYTVVEDDGTRVTNRFRAGAGIGYEVSEVSRTAGPRPAPRKTYQPSAAVAAHSHGSGATPLGASSFSHGSAQATYRTGSGSGAQANTKTNFGDDGSYSFSYNTDSHHRSESGADGRVTGDFSFVAADDGQRRELKYEAGSDTGFIVEADHLPVGPAVPGADDGKPSGAFARYQDKNFVDPLANTASDSSYQFGFDSDTYSRSESSDKDGNVVGTYTVVEDDGTRVTNRFRAGAGIGYEVSEVSRSAGPRPAARKTYQQSSGATQSHGFRGATSGSNAFSHGSGHASYRGGSDEDSNTQATFGDDGSYSFSYNTDSHHRSESGANGRVTGDFSFVAADDGKRRELSYEAGSDTGFIVKADHLPVGPAVPGAEHGQPSGAFARYQDKNFVDPLAKKAPSAHFRQSSGNTGAAHVRASSAGASISHQPTPYSTRRVHSASTATKSRGSSSGFRAASSSSHHQGAAQRSSFMKKPGHSVLRSSDFTLNTYEPSSDADKFGYVIRYH